jgi:chemotaxis protein histidine kinase CheA
MGALRAATAALQGEVLVESTEGRGTTITLSFPQSSALVLRSLPPRAA